MVSSQFLCHDILSKVFEHLDPGRPSELESIDFPVIVAERIVRKDTLALSARACHAFTAPALDVLWRNVDAFDYILGLFPTYSPTHCGFTDAIADAEWQRFQVYASRVRYVCGSFGQGQQEQVWMVLLQKSGRAPLFPHLESLAVGPSLGGLMSLLCPTVYRLHIWFPDPSTSDDKIGSLAADVLRPHIPHILELKLYEYDAHARDQRPNVDFCKSVDICVLLHLEWLELSHPVVMTQLVIQALMTFPDLYHLSLNFSIPAEDRASMEASELSPGFFKLRELRLTASYEDVALFLQATEPVDLERLDIIRELEEWDDDFRGQEEAYAHIPRHIRSLHQVFTDITARDRPRSPGDIYSPEGFLPENVLPASLQTLPDLREVVVSCQHISGAFMDGSLLALCAAWPALEIFEYSDFTDVRQWTGPGAPTFDTLLAFAKAHPRLTRLTLPTLSAQGIPDIGAFTDGGALQGWPVHALRLFRLCRYMSPTPMLVLALAIDRAFPWLYLGDPRLYTIKSTHISDVARVDLLTLLLLAVQTTRKISDDETV